VTTQRGGHGAVREVCDYLLAARASDVGGTRTSRRGAPAYERGRRPRKRLRAAHR
jgi:hypothetical protein